MDQYLNLSSDSNSRYRLFLYTSLAMIAFAANSLLCRMALKETDIDASSFTAIRLLSGALVLIFLTSFSAKNQRYLYLLKTGNIWSALALFVYAVGFSFAYKGLSTGMGALILFAIVQLVMITVALMMKEKFRPVQWCGLVLSLAGLMVLLVPGLDAPPLKESILMVIAAVAWAAYTLIGKDAKNPTQSTAANFVYTLPLVLILVILSVDSWQIDLRGAFYASLSGGMTSALGYAIWYAVLPNLQRSTAAVIQLSVPLLAALSGVVFLDEALTVRLLVAGSGIIVGIALVVGLKQPAHKTTHS
ncbi:hypothetical protein PULV_b0324 [Pseudoalteromonas ulvae UL12]|uniref:DMT family transporter n=1 Tax=Pseudoalteromonas ulvae TaxID=107327 RepID=UPI00186BAE62|nr:DMT family transporter [Pseudoalteromonas ulvae]MBE0365690.1 hypothetical protein [Pseudoalteromonas ulvae UL12]